MVTIECSIVLKITSEFKWNQDNRAGQGFVEGSCDARNAKNQKFERETES